MFKHEHSSWILTAIAISITIFKVDEKLFGVETEKVFKLFKVPSTFHERYSDQEKVRLKDFEVRISI
jgi:hypothetical protein